MRGPGRNNLDKQAANPPAGDDTRRSQYSQPGDQYEHPAGAVGRSEPPARSACQKFICHRETAAAGAEDQHEVQRHHPASGWDEAQCAHVPARGDRLHHLGESGQLSAEGRPHQENLLGGHRQQQTNHGVPPGHGPALGQLQEHESQEDQEGGEERD